MVEDGRARRRAAEHTQYDRATDGSGHRGGGGHVSHISRRSASPGAARNRSYRVALGKRSARSITSSIVWMSRLFQIGEYRYC